MLQTASKYTLFLFLTGLLLFNTGGSLVFFKLKEKAIERKVTTLLASGQLDKDGLVRVEAIVDDEVKINGRWHDVVFRQIEHGKLVAYCLADDDETNWYNFMSYYTNLADDDDDNDDALRLRVAHSYYDIPVRTPCYTKAVVLQKPTNTVYLIRYAQAVNFPPTPPPKFYHV